MNLDQNQEDHRIRIFRCCSLLCSVCDKYQIADVMRDSKIQKNTKRIGETKAEGGKLVS